MKLQALRGFFYEDKQRGCSVKVSVGEIFEIPESDVEQANSLIRDRRAEPIDDSVPKKGIYRVVRGFLLKLEDGSFLRGDPGRSIKLSRPVAVRLMVEGKVLPEDENAWNPHKKIHLNQTFVKRMYDVMAEG